MGGEDAFIDGFYCNISLKNHSLNIILLKKETAD